MSDSVRQSFSRANGAGHSLWRVGKEWAVIAAFIYIRTLYVYEKQREGISGYTASAILG